MIDCFSPKYDETDCLFHSKRKKKTQRIKQTDLFAALTTTFFFFFFNIERITGHSILVVSNMLTMPQTQQKHTGINTNGENLNMYKPQASEDSHTKISKNKSS